MGRPLRRERAGIVDTTLTLRLTHEDRALLHRLVELRSMELAVDGLEATAASYVRGLIRRDALARGLVVHAEDADDCVRTGIPIKPQLD